MRFLSLCMGLASLAGLAGCGALPADGRVRPAAVLPGDSEAAGADAAQACPGASPVPVGTACSDGKQRREQEKAETSRTILDIHAHGGR